MKSEVKISNEEILLIGLSRLEFSDELLTQVKALIPSVTDWNYFSHLANAHGVAALVSHNIEEHQLGEGIPWEVMTFLRNSLMMSLSRNTFNLNSISEVLWLFSNEKIKTVLLKGLALEIELYGNAGLRQMSDVDILIARDECIKARDILLSNGYVSLPVKSSIHKLIIFSIGKHLPSLIKKGTSVEIHHDLFGAGNYTLTKMIYDTSYRVEIKGESAYVPQPQLFFLYLVKHLHLHEMNNESQLRLYTDLVVLIEKFHTEIINYDLLRYASEAGISEYLAQRLELLRDLWGMTFPGWIDEFISRWHNEDALDKFFFFLKSPKDNPSPDKAQNYRNQISEIPGLHRKLLFLAGDVFPSLSFMKKRYGCDNKWKLLKYYPHRLGKILWLLRK